MNKKPLDAKLPEAPILSLQAIERERVLNTGIRQSVQQLDQVMESIRSEVQNNARVIHEAIGKLTQSWQPAIEHFNRYNEAKIPLKHQGILPHRSTPWGLFNFEAPEKFPDAALEYYREHWNVAEEMFRSDIDGYAVSEDAKGAFIEAVQCHSQGLYRASVLTLLPAAEMEFRRAFVIGPGSNAAGLEELRIAVMDAPAGVILSHIAPIDLFKILDEHLYVKIKTPEDVERFSLDSIPNRHAAIHGLVHYKSGLNSLNALIIADYVFFLISQLSEYLEPDG